MFEGKAFRNMIKQLDSNNLVEIVGLKETGLYLFVDYYINMKIAEGYTVKKRELNEGWQLGLKELNNEGDSHWNVS